MNEKTKQYSQIFDDGIKSGVIAQIGEKVLALLAALACFMDKDGRCYPKKSTLSIILGKSKTTIAEWIALAKNTKYHDIPVITVAQKKKLSKGKWEFSSNQYQISQPIREELISRYYSAYGNPYTENNELNQDKKHFPQTRFPQSENTPTNDNPSVNRIYINEMKQSLINKSSFNGISPAEFEVSVNSADEASCLDMARWLGEYSMNYILKQLNDKKCGIAGIEWAFGMTKEDCDRGGVRDKRRLFNFYIKKYKQDK